MNRKKNIILVSIGFLLILECLSFLCNGKHPEHQTGEPPINWKVGSKLKEEWKHRRLLEPSNEIPGFPSEAVVVLAYLGRYQEGEVSVKWPSVAFAIGDGTLILTAAHCVDDFDEVGTRAVSPDIVVISPYYGDVFDFEILAVDKEADLAILKAPWPSHPALTLASEEELKMAKEVLVAGYPPQKVMNSSQEKPEPPYWLSRQIRMEKLPVLKASGKESKGTITLRGTRFIGNGWSGSAIVLPKTGKAIGVLSRLSLEGGEVVTKILGIPVFRKKNVLTRRDAVGCGTQSIKDLLRQHGLESAAERKPCELQPVENAEAAFSLAIEYIETHLNNNFTKYLAIAQKLVVLRPESVQANLLLAESAYHIYMKDSSRKDILLLAESNFKEAIRLGPDSAHAHSSYANFLTNTHRHEEALAETEAALAINPNDQLALVNRMLILTETEPNKALELGRELTEQQPNKAHYWFVYSNVLRASGRYDEALEAAQKAVDLKPNGFYEGALATALKKLGRLDEAELYYRKMTKDCGCQRCWFKFAAFLINHRTNKLNEAEKALNLAESKKSRRISEKNFTILRSNINLAKLRSLKKRSPEKAEVLCRQLLGESPENGHYWHALAGILRTLGKNEEASQAAYKSVELCPDRSYRPRLADTLAKAGRLDKAEQTYKEMLHDHPDRPKYWFWYAKFLNEYCPDRQEEAHQALEKAQTPDTLWSVPSDELRELQKKVGLKPTGVEDCNKLNSAAYSLNASFNISTDWSISSAVTFMAGINRRTVSCVQLMRSPFSQQLLTISPPGSLSWIPIIRPMPRI